MIFNQNNLNVAKIAANSRSTRQELTSVFFTDKATTATDSFRLLEVSTPGDVKPEDYPQMQGYTAMRGVKPFMVSAEFVKKIKLPSNQNLPTLENLAIKHADEQKVEFMTTDLETFNITTARKIEGQFPEYEKLFGKGEPVSELVINADFLQSLLDIMKKLNPATAEVKIKLYRGNKPMVLEAKNNNQSARALLMPIKIN